jgi:hypothetical protein
LYDPGRFTVVITPWADFGDTNCGFVVEIFLDKNIICVQQELID